MDKSVAAAVGVLAGVWGLLGGAVSEAASARARPEPGMVVLDNRTALRCHFTWRSVQVRRRGGRLQFVAVRWRSRGKATLSVLEKPVSSPPPPERWAEKDFDDGAWVRARPPLFTRGTRNLALICARGKFLVTDPAGVRGARLELDYRGGAVVYLNGREIARGHLPEGRIGFGTPAEDYPEEAYVAPDGYQLRWIGFGEPAKYADRFALRRRRLQVAIPAAALRKGVNVLAVEVHRAPVSEVFYTAPSRGSRDYYLWDMVALDRIRLTAAGGIAPNVRRPKGFQVWNQPTYVSVHNVDFGDPAEPLRPVRIAGARGGFFSGKVVVGSDGSIRGLRATVSDLKGPAGRSIPASAVRIRYGLLAGHAEAHSEDHRLRPPIPYGRVRRRFDALSEQPPEEVTAEAKAAGAVVPVWVTVHVPAGAAPGRYRGSLTIAAEAHPSISVPLEVSVAGWRLPEPKRFRSFLGLVQSPESLALHYQVPMWSEAHWRLIDRSFELMGQLGVKTVYIPLLARTYFGNEHSMVRWIRRADGSWGHDFSIVERYLDTAVRHLGRVPVVCVYCWDVNTGSNYMGVKKTAEKAGMPFTVVDPQTGRLTVAVGPKWGDERIRAFWKPVFAGLRRLLARRGLADSMMVGISGDRRPYPDAVEDIRAAAPEAAWVSSSHSAPDKIHGQPVGYRSFVWGVGMAPDPAEKRYYGWKTRPITVAFPRYGSSAIGHGVRTHFALGCYRIAMESALTAPGRRGGLRGIGRCGADFWAVLSDKRGRRRAVLGRFPESSAWHGGRLRNSTPYLLAPGPDGPIATARFEALREGIQEAEARIFIERALTDPPARARLGEALARRAQALLDERVRANRQALAGGGRYLTWRWFAGSGVRRRTESLYAVAAEVADALTGRAEAQRGEQ